MGISTLLPGRPTFSAMMNDGLSELTYQPLGPARRSQDRQIYEVFGVCLGRGGCVRRLLGFLGVGSFLADVREPLRNSDDSTVCRVFGRRGISGVARNRNQGWRNITF
jgi:hypothetical protein